MGRPLIAHPKVLSVPFCALWRKSLVRKAFRCNALNTGMIATTFHDTFSTDEALDCLEAIAKEFPNAYVGASTVLSADQSKEVIRRGARFIVSPGLDAAFVNVAKAGDVLILPCTSPAPRC